MFLNMIQFQPFFVFGFSVVTSIKGKEGRREEKNRARVLPFFYLMGSIPLQRTTVTGWLPDRLFHYFRASKTVDRRTLCSLESSIEGFEGSEIVKVTIEQAGGEHKRKE